MCNVDISMIFLFCSLAEKKQYGGCNQQGCTHHGQVIPDREKCDNHLERICWGSESGNNWVKSWNDDLDANDWSNNDQTNKSKSTVDRTDRTSVSNQWIGSTAYVLKSQYILFHRNLKTLLNK